VGFVRHAANIAIVELKVVVSVRRLCQFLVMSQWRVTDLSLLSRETFKPGDRPIQVAVSNLKDLRAEQIVD